MTTLCITQRTYPGRDCLLREGEEGVLKSQTTDLKIGCKVMPVLLPSKKRILQQWWIRLGAFRDQYRVTFPVLPLYSVPMPTRCLLGLEKDLSLPQPTRHQCWAKVPSIANFFHHIPPPLNKKKKLGTARWDRPCWPPLCMIGVQCLVKHFKVGICFV